MDEKVFVYFNLHKKKWSVKSLKTGLVIAHCDNVLLRDCKFKVSERGRQRVLKERVKNVHAGVVGILTSSVDTHFIDTDAVTYNPYKYETFVKCTNLVPIYNSNEVLMVINNNVPKVYAK